MKNIRAGSVQFNHASGDKAANLRTIRSFCEQAARQGVELLVFSEMCITGYWHLRSLGREKIDALVLPDLEASRLPCVRDTAVAGAVVPSRTLP